MPPREDLFLDYSQFSPGARDLCEPFMIHDQVQNEFEGVYNLERRSLTTKLLRSLYTPVDSNSEKYVLRSSDLDLPKPQHLGSQFARRLFPALTRHDLSEGRDDFRSITPTTVDEAEVLGTTDDQFEYIYNEVKHFLSSTNDEILDTVSERFSADSSNGHENQSAYTNNDRYQFRTCETRRSLGRLLLDGLEISVDQEGIVILTQAVEENDGNSSAIIDIVKNWPILTIGGFEGSKLSLAIHDAFDHGWTYATAEKLGLFDKYSRLFTSIGSPQNTDIFKREGEILASLSFGMRYWENQDGFIPIIDTRMICDILNQYLMARKLEPRHMDAFTTIHRLAYEESAESQNLGFVISNYITTLHEQRRRYGRIWQKDNSGEQIDGELNPLSPDFLCMFIDFHTHLYDPTHGYRENLDAAHLIVEDFLYGVGSGRYNPNEVLKLNIKSILGNDTTRIDIPDDRLQWLTNNPRFSSIKERVVSHA